MEMQLNVNDEWIDNIIVARLKNDYEFLTELSVTDSSGEDEDHKRAIVTLMGMYMTYDDYFKWREKVGVNPEYTNVWDKLRNEKGNA